MKIKEDLEITGNNYFGTPLVCRVREVLFDDVNKIQLEISSPGDFCSVIHISEVSARQMLKWLQEFLEDQDNASTTGV